MYENHQRREAMQRVAYHLDMEYQEEDEWGLENQLQDFRLFKRGFRGRIRHILRKQDALMHYDLRIFDYRYLVWTGKSSRRVSQTIFFLESKSLALPQFWMQPETIFNKVGEYLGQQDIDFPDFPEFSRQYLLRGHDEEYIRTNFQESVLHYFNVHKGWCLEGIGYYMLLYRRKKLLQPGQIRDLFAEGNKVFDLLTRHQASDDWIQ